MANIQQASISRTSQLAQWFSTRLGKRLLAAQQQALRKLLPRCFGHYALQQSPVDLALEFSAVACCYQLISDDSAFSHLPTSAVMVDMQSLPFESASINVILLHHTLDTHEHPHQLLREIERVLAPGGRLVIVGFNPWSFWGVVGRTLQGLKPWLSADCQRKWHQHLPWDNRFLSAMRLKDWLQLLNFDVDTQQTLTLNPWLMSSPFNKLSRYLGAAYMISGVKRATCLTIIKPRWSIAAKRFSSVTLPLTPAR